MIIRDEARHVTFGINYLEEFVDTLSEEEKEERAQFAYEACWLSRERLLSTDVYENFGWDVEDARQFQLGTDINKHFQKLLFQRVMPNLRRIGLLIDSVKDKFEDLGILEFASSTQCLCRYFYVKYVDRCLDPEIIRILHLCLFLCLLHAQT